MSGATDHERAHDFDFWIGEWEVTGPDGTAYGRNSVTAPFGNGILAAGDPDLMAGGAERYRGFKCPHCKLFVPAARIKA